MIDYKPQSNISKICLIVSMSFFVSLTSSAIAVAQNTIIPDTTLGAEQSGIVTLDANGLPIDVIDGGAIRGQNLFHSFLEFNVAENRGAYFRIPVDSIEHVLSRVTGANPSEILGTLGSFNAPGVTASPTFYLINPNGVLFGPNSSLDLPASFLVTTGNEIELGEMGLFSASDPNTDNLLSIDPSALIFSSSSASTIVNQAEIGLPAAGFLINGPLSFPRLILTDGSEIFQPWGLQVVDGQTLGLIAGDILLEGYISSVGVVLR